MESAWGDCMADVSRFCAWRDVEDDMDTGWYQWPVCLLHMVLELNPLCWMLQASKCVLIHHILTFLSWWSAVCEELVIVGQFCLWSRHCRSLAMGPQTPGLMRRRMTLTMACNDELDLVCRILPSTILTKLCSCRLNWQCYLIEYLYFIAITIYN